MWGILLTLSSLCKPQAIHKYHWEFGLELDEVEGEGFLGKVCKNLSELYEIRGVSPLQDTRLDIVEDVVGRGSISFESHPETTSFHSHPVRP